MRDETGKVVFDEDEQAEVDRIIGERLARAKSEKPSDYDDLKDIEKELEDFGYSGTPAEKKAAIKAYKEELKQQQDQQNEVERLRQMEEDDGLTPAQAKRFKELEDKLEKSTQALEEITGERKAKKDADELSKKQKDDWNNQVFEFGEKYPDTDIAVLEIDEDFIEYATGRAGTLSVIYEGYVKLTSKLEKKTADEIRAKYKSKELMSTGTGKGSRSESGDYSLTESQKNLAKSAGMSYKEYADLLKFA